MRGLSRRQHGLVPLAIAGTLVLAGCVTTGNQARTPRDGDTVIASGSSTVEPVTSLAAEDFSFRTDGFNYEVDGPGTGDGFALFCDGLTDISNASRTIKDEEAAACAENGIEYVELRVAVDGISVITSKANDAVDCLSLVDLYALLGPESQGIGSWDAAGDLAEELAVELGDEFGAVHIPYPDAPLEVTAPGEESGTYDSFTELVFEDIAEIRGTEPVARADYVASAEDNVIIEGVSGSPASLGWVGFAFFEENANVVRALEVDGGTGCVAPTRETIASNEYPISRDLFIYVNTDRAEQNGSVADFVDYYLSDDGLAVVDEAGYVSLTPEALAETRAAWTDR